ncbi:nucleosome assembly protein [Syncephalis fuscata]|nr:nucleosome assembly protein [Syncephalis fuscata]
MTDAHPFEKALLEAEKIEDQLNKIEERFQQEKAKLTGQFELEKASLYKERADIVGKIDGFWSIVLESTGIIDGLLIPGDEEALSHLINVMVERDAANPANFKIIFTFTENEFFTNTEITKSFKLEENKYTTSKVNIDWKKGKDLVTKDEGGNADEEDETIVILPGFFTWIVAAEDQLGLDAISLFHSATSPDDDEDDSDLDDEEDIEESDNEEDIPALKSTRNK